jgi:CheY-like chemotaxis protein
MTINSINSDTKSKIIIGVDDLAENLLFLKANLKPAGYTFIGAASGAECLDLVHRVKPSLILLDIQMPTMDGIETCRRLRETTNMRNTPIVFLTAMKTQGDLSAGVAAGGNDFIIKPFDQKHLLERVRHWAGRQVGVRGFAPLKVS